jgi:hypothetical protein
MRYITKPKSPRLNYNASISNGMILAYPFGRGFPYGITNRAKDYSRAGNHGTINGDPFIKPTPWGGGLDFSSDYIIVKNSEIISKLYNTTVSIVFKPDDITGERYIYAEEDAVPSPIAVVNIEPGAGNKLRVGIWETGVGWHFIYSNSALVADTWYHAVWIRSSQDGQKLYLNRIEQSSDSFKGITGNTVTNAVIGRISPEGGKGYFDGIIDNILFWKRTLSKNEIIQVYKNLFKPYVHTRILDGIAVSEETEKSILRGVLRGMNVGFS